MDISNKLLTLRENIISASKKAGSDPDKINIVAVTKFVCIEKIEQAINCGLKLFGENYIQEAKKKIHSLNNDVKWHFIGHLQKNKTKSAVEYFDMIESVDSFELAEMINKAAFIKNKIQSILIQVNPENEASKSGILPEETIKLIVKLTEMKNLLIEGLMAIHPFYDEPEKNRKNFSLMRELKLKIDKMDIHNWTGKYLSMGMTDDYTIAIQEGSNMIRIGRFLFGDRPISLK